MRACVRACVLEVGSTKLHVYFLYAMTIFLILETIHYRMYTGLCINIMFYIHVSQVHCHCVYDNTCYARVKVPHSRI